MALYCQEVHNLENKFDGLELKHILRQLNEAVNSCAKMASSQESIPAEIFTNDQFKPSIRSLDPAEAGNEPIGACRGTKQASTLQANGGLSCPASMLSGGGCIDPNPAKS